MDLIVSLTILILFDLAAWRWGVDSRPPFDEDLRMAVRTPRRAI
jgi:hypothetical protein